MKEKIAKSNPPDPAALETPACRFVYYEDQPPFVRYLLFHPDHESALRAIFAPLDGDPDYQTVWQLLRRFGELLLAIDEYGFTADLYLDRQVIQEDQADALIQETRNFLNQIHPGPEGGVLTVHWTKEFASYSFGPARV